jgi:hypothetical protein
MSLYLRLLPLGDSGRTLEFGDTIDRAVNARVMGFAQRLTGTR